MTTIITIFLLGALAMLLLRRLLLALLRWGAMVVVVAVAGRMALWADPRLAQREVVSTIAVAGVVTVLVVGVLCYAIIYHSLIRADEQRDIERARETAKRRRLW